MANGDFLRFVGGKITEVFATVTSLGASNAGDLVKLGPTGRLDESVLPTGIGAETMTAPTSENLTAGDLVNVWDDGGTTTIRRADASDASRPAHGFVLAGVTAPANATVYFSGVNDQVSGLTGGDMLFLHTTPGDVTDTAPEEDGELAQHVGFALSPTSMYFSPTGVQVVRAADEY